MRYRLKKREFAEDPDLYWWSIYKGRQWIADSAVLYKTEEQAKLHWWGFKPEEEDGWEDGTPFEWYH